MGFAALLLCTSDVGSTAFTSGVGLTAFTSGFVGPASLVAGSGTATLFAADSVVAGGSGGCAVALLLSGTMSFRS